MIRRKVYVTSSTLDGKCKDLQAEDGDEDQSRQLSACAAWVQEQEEDADGLEDFVMEQLSSKTSKKDHTQRDLRTFFALTPSSSQSNCVEQKTENITGNRGAERSLAKNSKEHPISVLDSDEDDFPAWDDVDEDILISEVSESLEVSEKKTSDIPSQTCEETLYNEDNDLEAGGKPVEQFKQTNEEKQCPLKPKMLKFKKVKDGKLSFSGSTNYTKIHKKESKCVHVSPLKFVGNDPETESQTMQGYLDAECEAEIVKAEQKDDCSNEAVCSPEDSRQMDRGFFASLQDADIECVAVVCRKTSGIGQNKCTTSHDNAGEATEQEMKDEREEKQDTEEGIASNEIQADMLDITGKPADNPTELDNSSYNLESEHKRTSQESFLGHGQRLDGSCSQMETDSVSELGESPQICNQEEKRLCEEKSTGNDVLNMGDFAGKNNAGPGPVVTLNRATVERIPFADAKQSTCGGNNNQNGKCVEGRNDRSCNIQTLQESTERSEVGIVSSSAENCLQDDARIEEVFKNSMNNDSSDDFKVTSIRDFQEFSPACSSFDSSFSSAKSLSQNNTCTKSAPNRNTAGVASVCMDDDSSDEFQASSIRNSQTAPPVCNAVKPNKAKKRKATNKKSKTASQEARNIRTIRQKAPVEWSCTACTFINDGQLLECSICFTPRVTCDESSCTPNKEEFSSGSRNGVVEKTEVSDVYKVRVETKTANFVGKNGEESGERLNIVLDGTNGEMPASINARQIVDQTQGKAVHDLLVGSKAASRTTSTSTTSIAGPKEEAPEENSDTSCVAEPGLPPWSCSACTFLNMSQMIECTICFTPRRRSQRLSASKHALTAERQEEDCLNKKKSSKRKRWKGGREKKDETPQHMEVDTVSGSVTRVDDSGGVNPTTNCDHDTLVSLVESSEGLTSDQEVHVSHDTNETEAQSGDRVDSSEDSSDGIKPKPRKRLKLEDVDASSAMSDVDISDFSDDSDNNNGLFTCSESAPSSSAQKESTLCTPFNNNNMTSSGDCVLVTPGDKMEPKPLHSPEIFPIDHDNREVDVKKRDISCRSVDAIANAEEPLVVSSPSSTDDNNIGDNLLQSSSKDVESLEELTSAAEEIFMSEWEDDDCWWEEGSSSDQGSFPSSGETTSKSPTLTSPGFTKCSDLYSVAELKNKLQEASKQPKTCTTATVDNVDDKMQPLPANQGNFTPETAAKVEEEETDEEEDAPEPMKLKFCLSLYTERVYLYDEDDSPLEINFCMSDVKNCNIEDLPAILHHDENLRQAKRLLEAWKRMGEGKKRILRKSALVFDDPLQAYELARKGMSRESSYVRHPSKESQIQNVMDAAEEVGGKVRVIKRPKIISRKRNRRTDGTEQTNGGQSSSAPPLSGRATSTNTTQEGTSSKAPKDTTCHQAVRADGIPLCLFCKGPVEFVERIKCSEWDARFCSYDCKREYQVRVSGTAARRALFESERGICQSCFLDAHTLYQSITALSVRERPAFLAQTPYATLPQQVLRKMVMEPKEGMFWEADHITPVSEGGGECGLENYRTLCIMCHRKATAELNRRLKQQKCLQYAVGYADISTFFRPLS